MVRAARRDKAVRKAFDEWTRTTREQSSEWRVLMPVTRASDKGATLDLLDDGSVLATGDVPNDDTYTLEFALDRAVVFLHLPAVKIRAVVLYEKLKIHRKK